jgi:peptidyl-prolyl cis-trans isomerase A (cyclophilin A)
MKTTISAILVLAIFGCGAAQEEKPKDNSKVLLDLSDAAWKEKAPDTFKAKFSTSKGDFTILVERAWSPLGADRFYCLVKNGYYDDVRFFRVVEGFMAQFGIHGNPEVNKVWREASIKDDPVVKSNLRGWVTYAMRGPNTRTTQLFINYADKNKMLDGQGFSPFGQVVEGMEVVDKLYSGYGEGAPRGSGPNQMRIQSEGNAYLSKEFKDLDYVKSARIVAK